MYHDETNFGFNKFGSNMHPQGARGFYFCKNGSWTPCTMILREINFRQIHKNFQKNLEK